MFKRKGSRERRKKYGLGEGVAILVARDGLVEKASSEQGPEEVKGRTLHPSGEQHSRQRGQQVEGPGQRHAGVREELWEGVPKAGWVLGRAGGEVRR